MPGLPSSRKRLLTAALLLLAALNLVAFCHAWRFTHFVESGRKTTAPEHLTPLGKIKLLLTGVQNPKPVNSSRPAFPYQTVFLTSPNGRLETWYAPDSAGRGIVALFHGYTSDKSKLLTEAAYFRHLGYGVLLADFAGSGGSEGNQITVGYREAADVAAAFRWLQQQRPAQPVVLYGVSMGAVAILRAEAELGVRPAANIVECPYGSMRQTAYNRFHSMHLPGFPMADLLVFWGGTQNGFWAYGLKAEDYAKRVTTPTLLLWGAADARVTRAETDAIFINLAGPKRRHDFPNSGHEPYWWKYPVEWKQQVRGFLQH